MSTEPQNARVAIKVDCDTYEGTRRGIPNLLRLFADLGMRASFFFTLGPDRSGRAAARLFTRKGFLGKMLRSNPLALYGPRTMLYGTLLPAPRIGARLAPVIRSVASAGHEVGVHGWDHVRWHDRLDRMSEEEIERDYGGAHQVFAEIFARPARSSAAPGWHATAASLAVQERQHLLYASDTRGGAPFFPEAGGRRFQTLEIPTTLPTWDEMLGTRDCRDDEALLAYYRRALRAAGGGPAGSAIHAADRRDHSGGVDVHAVHTDVHSIHTEVEGTARLDLFRRQLEAWSADGVRFVTLDEIAREALAEPTGVPRRRLVRAAIPHRAGLVTTSAPAAEPPHQPGL